MQRSRGHRIRDAYDHDPDTASVYDSANGDHPFSLVPESHKNPTPVVSSNKDEKKKIVKNMKDTESAQAKKDGQIPDPAPDTPEQTEAKAAAKADSGKAFGNAAPSNDKEA